MKTVNTEKLDAILKAKADLMAAKAAKDETDAAYAAALDKFNKAAMDYDKMTL